MTIVLTTYVSLLHDQHIGFGFENKRHSILALASMQKDGRHFWIIVLKNILKQVRFSRQFAVYYRQTDIIT